MLFLKKIKDLFTEHPGALDESYLQHLVYALFYSFGFFLACIACFIHAFFPFLFTTTASTIAESIVDSAKYRSDDI